jgi:hypothetical protein
MEATPHRGSKSNIPCCALLARVVRVVRATFASDSRMWRASGENPAWIWRIFHANVTRNICVRSASCSSRIMQMLRAPAAQGMLLLDPSVYVVPLYICIVHKILYWCDSAWGRPLVGVENLQDFNMTVFHEFELTICERLDSKTVSSGASDHGQRM